MSTTARIPVREMVVEIPAAMSTVASSAHRRRRGRWL
jgi:hypothetical protein